MTGVALASLASMPPPVVVEYLLVGGGGGGGISKLAAAGGGGGGEGKNANAIVAPGDTWTITVGAGGTAWNYFAPYFCPSVTLSQSTGGDATCISPLNIWANGGGFGAGNCTYPVASPFGTAWSGSGNWIVPNVPPFNGGGVGGGGSICQNPTGVYSNRLPARPGNVACQGSGSGGCGANNNSPLAPPITVTPIFGTGGTPSGGCWRIGGGGGGGAIPPALGNNGTNGTFSGGSPGNNLIVGGGGGGAGFFVPWAGEPAGAYYGGGGGGGVKNNLRPLCPGGTTPLFRCQDNRIRDDSGPGGIGGGGTGPREDYSPAGVGYGITQAVQTPPGNFRFGEANRGGGGSGSGSTCASPSIVDCTTVQVGAFGGSGVAFIRYPANFRLAVTTGNPTVSVKDGYIIYKFTGSGTIQF